MPALCEKMRVFNKLDVIVQEETQGSGRKASINRQSIIDAAIALASNERSIASLSLREIARQAGIAPNSFYRHFRDTDELAIAIIDEAGLSLRQIIKQARSLMTQERSVVRLSVETFMQQLDDDRSYLPILLREGQIGSEAFKEAVAKQLAFFAQELQSDLEKFSKESQIPTKSPDLIAKAITRLVFAMGSDAINMDSEQRKYLNDDLTVMVKMILRGAQQMALSKCP